ncbi:MAG: hypothetical protein KJO32_03080 [Deltaproteobacteria bacterium]|nr:hypothetical protein [Deltaproteobacteria bacterium]
MRTCVLPGGTFFYGIHKPSYHVSNLRQQTQCDQLGNDQNDNPIDNRINFPEDDLEVQQADWIYEIANPFPFRGTTFIGKDWADRSAADYERIRLTDPPQLSLSQIFKDAQIDTTLIEKLPRPVQLSLATTSTDSEDLVRLAHLSCSFQFNETRQPVGLNYELDSKHICRPAISDDDLFEAVANNPALPDQYKIAMVIRPGAQGESEIIGDFHQNQGTHIYEYLRKNSYIGGGHYAANMAENAIRYRIKDLSQIDLKGLRHLYYQRTYVRLAGLLNLPVKKTTFSAEDLEDLRIMLLNHPNLEKVEWTATLWGWNFGFDFAPSGYRLHASHQQVHQQYAMIPSTIAAYTDNYSPPAGSYTPFSSGDMVQEVIEQYQSIHNRNFFPDYLEATMKNKRMDGRNDLDDSLIVWQDDKVLLFVPKAQTSQWELQLMTKPIKSTSFPGNVLETDLATRSSLDNGMLKAQQALAGRGAQMVTAIEYSKRLTLKSGTQPLIYCFLPKLPQSPGAFSEAHLRFINGHYPEDFAAVCRQSLSDAGDNQK